jgi:hypothetical protein
MGAAATATTTVVLYPSPGMGHLVSMIELGKLFGARGLSVTIVVVEPPFDTGATGPFLAGVFAANPSISFHRLPKLERLPPIKAKHHEALALELIRLSKPHLCEFLASASPAPAALVVDVFCGVALEVAEELRLRVPAYSFTSGAEVLALFLHLSVLHEQTTASFRDMGEELVHVSGIPPFPATHSMLPMMDRETRPTTASLGVAPTSPAPRASLSTRSARWSSAPSRPWPRATARPQASRLLPSTASGRSSSRRR